MVIKNGAGFTFIEMIVVVAVIGVLASLIFASLTNAKVEAQYALAYSEMNQFMKMVQYAVGETGQNLASLTLPVVSNCATYSGCQCWTGGIDIRNIEVSSLCYLNWQAVINEVAETGGAVENTDHLLRDPWGSPYALQELEWWPGCGVDRLISAGPDGIITGIYWADNIYYNFSPSYNPPCYP